MRFKFVFFSCLEEGLDFGDFKSVVFWLHFRWSFAQGRINNVKITFCPLDGNSVLLVSEERWSIQLDNATLIALNYWGTNETDAYIKANVLGSSCSIRDQIFWVLLDEHNQSHELKITMEVMHVNETKAKIITVPIVLKMTPS